MVRLLPVTVLIVALTVNEAMRDDKKKDDVQPAAVVEATLEAVAREQSTEEVEALARTSETPANAASKFHPRLLTAAGLLALLGGGTDAFVTPYGRPVKSHIKIDTALLSGLVNGKKPDHFEAAGSNTDFGPHEYREHVGPTNYLNSDQYRKFKSMFGPVALTDEDGVPASQWSDDRDVFFPNPNNPKAETAVYVYTSKEGDPVGAFPFDSSVAKGMLEMADSGCNVAFKHVGGMKDLTNYLQKNKEKFKTVRYLVLGGHGSFNDLTLGSDVLKTGSPSMHDLAQVLKPLLSLDESNPSTVVLDSCQTASMTDVLSVAYEFGCSECNFAMEVAKLLGCRVLGYDEDIGRLHINQDFAQTGHLTPTADRTGPDWRKKENYHPFVIKFRKGVFDVHRALLEIELVESKDVELSARSSGYVILKQYTQRECMAECVDGVLGVMFYFDLTNPDDFDFTNPSMTGMCIKFLTVASVDQFMRDKAA